MSLITCSECLPQLDIREADRRQKGKQKAREGGRTDLGRQRWGEEVEDGEAEKRDEEKKRLKGQSAVIRM